MTEDISEFIKPSARDYVFYDKNGDLEGDETSETCAFSIVMAEKETYYIKFFRGVIFDPSGMDSGKINAINIEFKKVEKNTFDFYVQYLKTKKRNKLTWAERSNIDV